MRNLLRYAVIIFVLAVVIQFVPVSRENPPVTGTIEAPATVAATLRRSCFDCHSNETVWPWYSRVAPASWLVAHDVNEGREHLNFSTWSSLTPADQQKHFQEIAEVIEKGEMPMPIYTPLHPEARLSLEEITTIVDWAQGAASSRQ